MRKTKASQLWLMINPSRTGGAWKEQWRGTYVLPHSEGRAFV